MSGQILFFTKNKADYTNKLASATASQGAEFAPYVLNRSNLSAWITTGSVDADNTTLTIDLTEERRISDLILIKHNFKSFTVKYWDGASYQDFTPAINETTNTDETSYFRVTSVETSKVQITITGTQVPDSDKVLFQFILTERLGQLNGWPVIKDPIHTRNRTKNKMLSGKTNVVENVGGFSCKLTVASLTNLADLDLFESLYAANEGFLVWLCGSNEDQFTTKRQGYRLQDIYLMKCVDEYSPEYLSGLYKAGIKVEVELTEVVE